ncbi:hypothetical protein [Shewanella alkalitolerans]|nr:hypothetical protein [Shewanella alkalitolerans]
MPVAAMARVSADRVVVGRNGDLGSDLGWDLEWGLAWWLVK